MYDHTTGHLQTHRNAALHCSGLDDCLIGHLKCLTHREYNLISYLLRRRRRREGMWWWRRERVRGVEEGGR